MARTEVESGMKSIKYILLIITVMFIVVSALMITLGLNVYSRYHDFSFHYESGQNFFTPSVLVTITGIVMLFITLFGFIGSIRESTCLVNLYALILGFMMILQIVVIIIGFTVDPDSILEYIRVPVEQYTTDREIQDEIDFLQTSLKCCGSASYNDYYGQQFTGNQSSLIAALPDVTLTIPESCCYKYSKSDYGGYCVGVWANGCTTAIAALVVQNTGVLGVLAMSVAFVQLLGIIFAVLLAKCIRKVKTERAYLQWKLTEQVILARMAIEEKPKQDQLPFVYIEQPDSTKA